MGRLPADGPFTELADNHCGSGKVGAAVGADGSVVDGAGLAGGRCMSSAYGVDA